MNTYTHQIGEDVGDLFKIISLNWHTKIRDYYECSHIDSHNPKKKKEKKRKERETCYLYVDHGGLVGLHR
jgi:hypothetical protein